MQQRTEEWYAARSGKFTSSRFPDLMARTKTGVSKLHEKIVLRVAIERHSGKHFDRYRTEAMSRGQELEEAARQAYEERLGVLTDEEGIVLHPAYDYISVSPDALCGTDGVAEFKCPYDETKHMGAIRHNGHVDEYKWQIQGLLWVTGRQWCDACSYDPRFPDEHKLVVCRVFRDEASIAELEQTCISSNLEVLSILQELEDRKNGKQKDRQDGAEHGPSVQNAEGQEGGEGIAVAEGAASSKPARKGRRKKPQ